MYPAEVESVLFGHPAVVDVAVIGVPDDRWGETVKAIVVLEAESMVKETALIAWCRERIAHDKEPTSIDFIDVLPRTASGKLSKDVLRALYWAIRPRRVIYHEHRSGLGRPGAPFASSGFHVETRHKEAGVVCLL